VVALALLGAFGVQVLAVILEQVGLLLVLVALAAAPLWLPLGFRAARQARVRWPQLWAHIGWPHLLWLLLFLSIMLFRVRNTREIREALLDSGAIYRILLVALVAAMIAYRFGLRSDFWRNSMFRGLVGLLTIYGLLSLLSTLWSVHPAWTAYKSAEMLVDIAAVAAILLLLKRREHFGTLFDWTYLLFGGLLGTVWIGLLVWPELALQPSRGMIPVQLFGVMPVVHANSVGEYSALLAFVAVARLRFGSRQARPLYYVLLTVCLASLILSQTRSAIGGFLLASFVVLALASPKFTAASVAVMAMALFSVAGLGQFLWAYLSRGQSVELMETFTGRMSWWTAAWEVFLENPLFGIGGFAAGRFGVLENINPIPSNLHNSFLEVLVGVGIIGLIPFVLVFAGTWSTLLRGYRQTIRGTPEHSRLLEALGILIIITIRSLFAGTLVLHPPLFFLLVVSYAEFLRRRYLAAEAPERPWTEARLRTAGIRTA
jgi:O-antigen ligase